MKSTTVLNALRRPADRLAVAAALAFSAASALGQSASSASGSSTVQLQEFEVLGSRIRRTEVDGPSPVSIYNAEEIRATGAMNLADFMRTLPQTYSGVGAGRNSAPDDLNMSAGQRTESAVPFLPFVGAGPTVATNAPVQTGVSGVSLRGLGSGSTLVLVDGRRVAQAGERNRGSTTGQGFVDLNTIPLGLIERVEIITDGASAIYGADAVAGVINIVLKKSWVGTEVSGSVKMTQHGGARERQGTVTTGFAGAGGKLRGTLAVDYYDRDPLYASQREFSKSMDYRTRIQGYSATGAPVYGTDQRIQWGYPASVQATASTGFVGIPGFRVLLAPAGSATTPAIGSFERRTTNDPGQTGTAIIAQGQRITNPAEWTQLVSAADRKGVTGTASYQVTSEIEAYGTVSLTQSRSTAKTLPLYVAGVSVSAANNIFGENISFGMLLPQWGQVWQKTKTDSNTVTLGLRGKVLTTWRWDAGYRWQSQKYFSISRSFNQTAFNFFANNNDPAQRFNPFIDERVPGAPSQAAILEQTALYPTADGRSGLESVDFTANGDLVKIWAGPVRMSFGVSYDKDKNTNVAMSYAGFPVVTTVTPYTNKRTTRAAFSELQVPLVGKANRVPLVERLEANLAGRYEDITGQESSRVPKYGATWAPFRAILFRGSYSEGYRSPGLTENRRPTTTSTSTINDPLRGNTPTPVTVVARPNPDLAAETSTNKFLGTVIETPWVKGLTLSVNYYQTEQRNAIQSLSTTVILNNPTLFPGFVVRNAPTAADTAAGWPGAVNTLYSQYVNFGVIRNESIDYGVDYRIPNERLGRWRLSVNAAKTIKQTRQLAVGSAPINDVGDTYSSPRWNLSSALFWSKGPWSASSSLSYLSGFNSNQAGVVPSTYTTPAMHLIDLRATYEFKQAVWGKFGKGMRLGVGVANLEDKEPPFFNNIYGFNAGLHGRWAFGRTFETTFAIPF
jgi:outer membrane receptor protein involved in Fe transport